MKPTIIKLGALHALGTAIYVVLVASFLSYTPVIFSDAKEKTVFIPIAMLLLLVMSATITGSLVFGRPVLWYLDGKKKEAVSLLIATVGWLFVMTIIAFIGVAVMK